MPADTSKRVRTESARKREGRENAEAIQQERAGKKAAAKACKDCRDEAADDDLLVEREGESPELTKLHVYTLRLESDNQCMRAKLTRRDEEDKAKPIKTIPEPLNKSDITVELIRKYLGLIGQKNDIEWSMIRHDIRSALGSAGLNWGKTWSKQDHDRVNTLFQVVESRRPELKRFANHWGSEFILKESFGNQYTYLHRNANKIPDTSNSDSNERNSTPDESSTASTRDGHTRDDDDTRDDDTRKANARMAKVRKAAAYRAAERKAKRQAVEDPHETDDNALHNPVDEDEAPYNDGETEPEDLPEAVRKGIECEEIGVPAKPKLTVKTAAKQNRVGTENSEVPSKAHRLNTPSVNDDNSLAPPATSTPADKPQTTAPAPTSHVKKRPVIYMKRGRGGKVVSGGRGKASGGAPAANMSSVVAVDTCDDDGVSSSSGQTTSGDDSG